MSKSKAHAEVLDLYLLQLQANGRSEHTLGQARRHIGLLGDWLRTQGLEVVGDVEPEHVARFLSSPQALQRPDGRPKLATSVNALRSSVRAFFGWAHAAGYTDTNPARLVRNALTDPGPPRALTEAEEKRLLAVLDGLEGWEGRRDRMLVLTMLRCGLRLGSALGLDVEDLDLDEGVAWIRAKGDRRERVLLSERLRKDLAGWAEEVGSGPLFPTRNRRRISARHARRRFAALLGLAKIRRIRGTHSLRHSFATKLYGRTRDVLIVKAALRHRSILSTVRYAAAACDELRAALATYT